jgi:GNAT superfamily N-acetyltransferase
VVEYSTERPVPPAEVLRLLRQTSWGVDRSEADIADALENAPLYVGAWLDGRLFGFARAVTDRVYRGFIEDVVVDEALRGRGIGHGLVQALLERLSGLEVVALDCEEERVPFYAALGLVRSRNVRMEIVRAPRGGEDGA